MSHKRLRILHLAFEDHRKPQSGGGARRTWEINRRLSADHDITVVTARYRGSAPRTEDGVQYRQCGLRGGYYLNVMSYHLCVPWIVFRSRADLIIEDFASPISSALVPLWTRRPTLAVVQWLFARETSRQYHLPFFVTENIGLKLHRRYVAVSEYIANEIHARSAGAQVDVVYAGISKDLLDAPRVPWAGRRREVMFLGRFQLQAKGLDRLIRAFAQIVDQVDVDLVLVGDGLERARVERFAAEANLGDRIRIEPWLEGEAKYERLRRAAIVAVPSMYETFGLVALEAMAAGTPVVGFAIPALAEVVPGNCGILAEPFDEAGLARAITALLDDPEQWEQLSRNGREHAATFTWDAAARQQQAAYQDAVARQARRRG